MGSNLYKIGDRVEFNEQGRARDGYVGDILLRPAKAREDGQGYYNYFIVAGRPMVRGLSSKDARFITLPENALRLYVERPRREQRRVRTRGESRVRERAREG